MRGMIEVTLVPGGEESMEDPTSKVAVQRRGRVSFIPSEFSIRRNVHGYSLPTRCICYTSMELIAARFAYLRLVLRW